MPRSIRRDACTACVPQLITPSPDLQPPEPFILRPDAGRDDRVHREPPSDRSSFRFLVVFSPKSGVVLAGMVTGGVVVMATTDDLAAMRENRSVWDIAFAHALLVFFDGCFERHVHGD